MSGHPSNPDQLMARALGVCWHSPTSDRWPCQEPLADWEIELICQRCGASGCSHDVAPTEPAPPQSGDRA